MVHPYSVRHGEDEGETVLPSPRCRLDDYGQGSERVLSFFGEIIRTFIVRRRGRV